MAAHGMAARRREPSPLKYIMYGMWWHGNNENNKIINNGNGKRQ